MGDPHATCAERDDDDAFSITQLTSTSEFWPSNWWFDCYLPRTTSAEISVAYMAFRQSQQLAEEREKEERLSKQTCVRKGGGGKRAPPLPSRGKTKHLKSSERVAAGSARVTADTNTSSSMVNLMIEVLGYTDIYTSNPVESVPPSYLRHCM